MLDDGLLEAVVDDLEVLLLHLNYLLLVVEVVEPVDEVEVVATEAVAKGGVEGLTLRVGKALRVVDRLCG